ncbi:MAG: hypothetical protein IJ050_02240 [Clostridia bacterium]|nr:hypothetical protein [Clostridia bacterium]
MKTLKKSLALLLAAITLFSTLAFVTANADSGDGRATVNVRVTAPAAGEKAEFSIKVDDERFVPGMADMFLLDTDAETFFAEFGKMPTSEEAVDKRIARAAEENSGNDAAYYAAYYSSINNMIKKGIAWIEYDPNDFQKLVDAGLADKTELEELTRSEYIGILLQSSAEYGSSFERTFGDEAKGISSTARFMKPGDTFKEGKSYMCWCEASLDVKAETAELIKAGNALMPYYEKRAEIGKKLETATEEEAAALNTQLDALNDEYSEKLDNYEEALSAPVNKCRDINGGEYYYPVLTVNGEKTEENMKSLWMAYYDFGEVKTPTILDRIIAFFTGIIDFIKNLFSFVKF